MRIKRYDGRVVVSVTENPILDKVVFEGNKSLKDNQLTPEIQSKPRGPLSRATVQADVERIDQLWNDCRSRFGRAGPWLFGEYTVADAMYAPVVLRFNTYGARISQTARWYMASVLEDAALQEWLQAAKQEPWTVASDEVG